MEITIIHTISPEVMALLQGILGLAGAGAGAAAGKIVGKPSKDATIPLPVKPTSAPPVTVPDTINAAAAPETEAGAVTVEQVRLAVNEKKDTHKTQIRALLSEFGVTSVSALLPDNRAAFLEKVNNL